MVQPMVFILDLETGLLLPVMFCVDGVTGGFAGGERGVQRFIENGDLDFGAVDAPKRQWSPVVFATLVAIAGSVGAIVLTDVFNVSENLLTADVINAELDSNTKILLEVRQFNSLTKCDSINA